MNISPWQRPWFTCQLLSCALKGRSDPPPFQGGLKIGALNPRGVAPGWHPPRRWRDKLPDFQMARICRLQVKYLREARIKFLGYAGGVRSRRSMSGSEFFAEARPA